MQSPYDQHQCKLNFLLKTTLTSFNMDMIMTKLLSLLFEAFLPPTALESYISQIVQIGAIMGIGLLYQRTTKRHIAGVLVQEIGKFISPIIEFHEFYHRHIPRTFPFI